MDKLDKVQQAVLMYGSCLGNIFRIADLQSLNLVTLSNPQKLKDAIFGLVNGGFIDQVFKDEVYRFVHDRVQQAGYVLLPEKSKAKIHKIIGESIITNVSVQEKETRLFENY